MATKSLVSAFAVLETVAELQPIGLSDLTRAVGLPKSTTQRMLLSLKEIGWLQSSESAPVQWSLTYHAISLCSRAGDGQGLRERALPVMNKLQLATTETIHLCAPDGDHLVLVERLDTAHQLRAFLPLGERVTLHASATGLAYLSACSEEYISDYLSRPLTKSTPDSITDPAQLRQVITEIRERGYSINVGGLSSGISSVGAPIIGVSGTPIAAVSVSGPSIRLTPDRFDDLGSQVAKAASQIGVLA
ncbi:MAG: IclR family transcriptional regulator [Brevibacterium linens]